MDFWLLIIIIVGFGMVWVIGVNDVVNLMSIVVGVKVIIFK